jgi:hypothetical protein
MADGGEGEIRWMTYQAPGATHEISFPCPLSLCVVEEMLPLARERVDVQDQRFQVA